MKQSTILFVLLLNFLLSLSANAKWLTLTGKVININTYASRETVLVTLDFAGDDVSECSNKVSFAISKSISGEARSRMFAMLLAAQSSNSSVQIAYNDVGNCEPWDSNPSAYRRIQRIIK